MRRSLGLVLSAASCALLVPSCTVSLFGSPEMTVIGAPAPRDAHGCEEPDDARRAREDATRCVARCTLGGGSPEGECGAVHVGELREGLVSIDMSDHDGVVVTMEICDVEGVSFSFADSPTADEDGGDAGSSEHDSHAFLDGTTLTLFAAERAQIEPSVVRNYVPESGCVTRTVVLADSTFFLVDAHAGLCGDGVFRVNPPVDDEGTPDARFHLARGQLVNGTRPTGTGVRSTSFCFY